MRFTSAQFFVGIIVVVGTCFSFAQEIQEPQGPLHDPTRPPQTGTMGRIGAGAVTPSTERIQMLLIGESRKYAIVDGVLLKPGDLHNQWRLSIINPESVVMRNASGTRVIRVSPSVVKTLRPQVGTASPSGSTRSNEITPTRRSP